MWQVNTCYLNCNSLDLTDMWPTCTQEEPASIKQRHGPGASLLPTTRESSMTNCWDCGVSTVWGNPVSFCCILTLWLPNKIFRTCHLATNKIFGFSPLAPNKIWPSTFPPTTNRMILFSEKVLVLCKSAVYLFCRELNLYKMVKTASR